MPATPLFKSLVDASRERATAGIIGGDLEKVRRPWNPDDHPRDDIGRFIEVGGIVELPDGSKQRVTGVKGGKVQVEDADGKKSTVQDGTELHQVAGANDPDVPLTSPKEEKERAKEEAKRRKERKKEIKGELKQADQDVKDAFQRWKASDYETPEREEAWLDVMSSKERLDSLRDEEASLDQPEPDAPDAATGVEESPGQLGGDIRPESDANLVDQLETLIAELEGGPTLAPDEFESFATDFETLAADADAVGDTATAEEARRQAAKLRSDPGDNPPPREEREPGAGPDPSGSDQETLSDWEVNDPLPPEVDEAVDQFIVEAEANGENFGVEEMERLQAGMAGLEDVKMALSFFEEMEDIPEEFIARLRALIASWPAA